MNRLVDAARKYIGVKWRHRGRSVYGLDCAGLVVLAYRDCGVDVPDFTLYGREPHNDGLVQHVTAALGEPLAPGAPMYDGDVIVQRFDREPHHLGIVTEVDYAGTPALNIIHSDGYVGRVLEVRLDDAGLARVTHIYRRAV